MSLKICCPNSSEYELPSQMNYKKPLAITIAVLACLAGLTATYFWCPTFHSLINNAFSEMTNVHLTVAQSLVYIALPIGGLALAIGLLAHVRRTHQRRLEPMDLLLHDESTRSLMHTLKEMKPTARGWASAGIIIAALVVISIVGFAIFQYVPQANQWVNQIFSHKFELWQALACVGGASLGTALLTGLIIHSIQYINEQREEQEKLRSADVRPLIN